MSIEEALGELAAIEVVTIMRKPTEHGSLIEVVSDLEDDILIALLARALNIATFIDVEEDVG
jgi:hypothetical protein